MSVTAVLFAVTLLFASATFCLGGPAAASQPKIIDDFESISGWSSHPAEGVELKLGQDVGAAGRAMRMDVNFTRGTGYAVARRAVSLDLPSDYVFRFKLRGEIPVNHLEFKLVDSTGANVWWYVRRDLAFPREWTSIRTRKRQIRFAWGPSGGGEIRHVAAIELAITAGEGGQGRVWIDDLEIEPLAPDSLLPAPRPSASSSLPTHEPERALDAKPMTGWTPATRDTTPWWQLDLLGVREFGGVTLEWGVGRHPRGYAVDLSSDGRAWSRVRTVRGGNGGRDPLALPESEARYLRVSVLDPPAVGRALLTQVGIEPLEWAATPEAYFTALARRQPRGNFPRPYEGQQCAWAVVGLDGSHEEALLSEDGMLETGKRRFSIEPFLGVNDRLLTWADMKTQQSLEGGSLPIPTVSWRRGELGLVIQAFARGDTSDPRVVATYRVTHRGRKPRSVTLYLALRPFQVNPPWQSVGMSGGTARIHSIDAGALALTPARARAIPTRWVRVDDADVLACDPRPDAFGATTLDQGDIVEYLRLGQLPEAASSRDPEGFASGALAFQLELPAGGERTVRIEVPLRPAVAITPPTSGGEAVEEVARDWEQRLGDTRLVLPPLARDLVETVRAQAGWILVNRDGAAIQPGSRSYDRSWIRDGSLTSSALLRLGVNEPVREFARWFASMQYDNGKVPCCASDRGPDPVTENDSHGQFIFLVAEYHRYTGDRDLVRELWPHVVRAVAHMDSLRAERRTAEWRTPEQRRFYGLLLPSISHEGYPNPMHSYWDDFFGYRGYVDAVYLAQVMGREGERARFAAARDTFARDLTASVAAAMAFHKIDFVPGCAELGDFDATSTTVALAPTDAADLLPEAALRATFERYWEFFRHRRDGRGQWEAFTPYEVRTIGSFVRLGWRERAMEAVDYFMAHRRPAGWRQWAEVETRRAREPRFIGDIPHTWVGSDFVRSVLDLFAYERARDSSLVIAAGIPWAWVATPEGVAIEKLHTPHGPLSYRLRTGGGEVTLALEPGLKVPPGGLLVTPPGPGRPFRSAQVDGAAAPLEEGGVRVRRVPASVVLRW